MTILPREDVVKAIRENVPKELIEQPIWIAYYFRENKDGTFSKPPVRGYSVDENKPSYTFEEVIKDGYPGIKINSNSEYVAYDIDDKDAKLGKRPFNYETLPTAIRGLLEDSGTYTEMSPSGCGVRAMFKCGDKVGLPGRTTLRAELALGGELFINSGYVTITGQKMYGDSVMDITKEELSKWYSSNGSKPEHTPTDLFKDQNPFGHPKVSDIMDALSVCRLDKSAAIRSAYKTVVGEDYNHYEYWIKIMAACHHYITVTGSNEDKVLSAVLDWSKTDVESWQGDDDVIDHWSSFTEHPEKNSITYNTLFKFARLARFNWPKEKLTKGGSPTGKPRITEYVNFKYLMDYHGIEIFHEPYTNALYVSADDVILDNYFSGEKFSSFFGKVGPFDLDMLCFGLWRLAQDCHYDNVTAATLSSIAKAFIGFEAKTFNLMETWLSTPYEELPVELKEPGTDPKYSNIHYLMRCIKYSSEQDMELTKAFFEAFFFGIVMPIYNPERIWPEHNFMLILTGPENCRKTTFLSNLMPDSIKRYLITHSTETLSSSKSLRDFLIQLSSSAILIIDEFEIFYSPANDSMFKTLVTSASVDYTPIYSKALVKVDRTAALAGTTNKSKLPVEQDSSRRLALVEVEFIDTDALNKINWHSFYNKYIEEGKKLLTLNQYPWKLPQEMIDKQYVSNERFRTFTDIEILVNEAFDFTHKFPGLHIIKNVQQQDEGTDKFLYSRKEVTNVLLQKNPKLRAKPSALSNVLERLCGKYTSTTRKKQDLPCAEGCVKNGVAQQKHIKKYIMPPRITDFVPEADMTK